jgi:hypothetical protein
MKEERTDLRFSRSIHLFPVPLITAEHAFPCEWCVFVWAPDISRDKTRPFVRKTRHGWCSRHQAKTDPETDLLSMMLAREAPLSSMRVAGGSDSR